MEGDKMSVTRAPGTAVSFTCALTQNTNYIHVYTKKEGTAPQRLFYYDVYYSKFTLESGDSPEKYRVYAGTSKSYTFTMLYLEERDSGTYYCALWDKHVGSYFLSTTLEILVMTVKNRPSTQVRSAPASLPALNSRDSEQREILGSLPIPQPSVTSSLPSQPWFFLKNRTSSLGLRQTA